MEALQKRTSVWWMFSVLMVVAALQIVWNPFGLSDLVQQYSEDMVRALVTGPLYGTFSKQKGHDGISVALIDDQTLKEMKSHWPISYRTHKFVLDALLAHCPRAVVVDFLFTDSRPNDKTLNELVSEVGRFESLGTANKHLQDCRTRHGVPLYFEATANQRLLEEFHSTNVATVDPTMLLKDGIARHYPIGLCDGICKPSLAVEVYRDLCAKRSMPDVEGCKSSLSLPNGAMELWWGTATDPINAKLSVAVKGGPACDSSSWIGRFYRAAIGGLSSVRTGCPYHSIIPVEALLDGRPDNNPDKDIDALIRNRVVFYGASLEGAKDESLTPVNGLLPDVFVHAMALDNLITLRGKPLHGSTTGLLKILLQLLWITPVMLVLSWLRTRYARSKRASREERSSLSLENLLEWLLELGWVALAITLAIIVGLALMTFFQVSVESWVGIVFVAAELAAVLLLGLPELLWGYARHVISGAAGSQSQGESK